MNDWHVALIPNMLKTSYEDDADVPVVGTVSHLADQKDFAWPEPIIEPLTKEVRLQPVLPGSGDHHYHDFFRRIGEQYPDQAAIA